MSTADPQRACGGKNNGYLSTLVNYQHICLRLSPLGCLTAQHTKYIKLTYICSTWPYWICWHHLNTNCHAMHDNSCSDKAHKAVFAVFAPAFLYVCLCDSLSRQVCARSWRVHGDVYLWVPQSGMLDHLVGKWDYSYLLPLRPAERQASDFAVTCFHPSHTRCLQLCYADRPSKTAAHVTAQKMMMRCLAFSLQRFPIFCDWMQSFIIIYTSQITSLFWIWWLSALAFLLDRNLLSSEHFCITCQSFGSWHSFVFLQPAEQPPKNQPRSNSSSSFINSR